MTTETTKETNPAAASLLRAVWWVAGTGLVFTLAAGGVAGTRAAISVGLGAALATVNLWALGRIVAAFFTAPEDEDGGEASPEESSGSDLDDESTDDPPGPELSKEERSAARGRGALWGIFAMMKLLGLFGLAFWLMQRAIVSPIPFVVGYGALPIGITVSTAFPERRRGARKRPRRRVQT